jgi:hypothetical protein
MRAKVIFFLLSVVWQLIAAVNQPDSAYKSNPKIGSPGTDKFIQIQYFKITSADSGKYLLQIDSILTDSSKGKIDSIAILYKSGPTAAASLKEPGIMNVIKDRAHDTSFIYRRLPRNHIFTFVLFYKNKFGNEWIPEIKSIGKVNTFGFPPVIITQPADFPLCAVAGEPFVFSLRSKDSEGDSVFYSLDAHVPAGMQIDSARGILTFTPADSQAGHSYPVGIFARDSFSLGFSSVKFNIRVTSLFAYTGITDTLLKSGDKMVRRIFHPESLRLAGARFTWMEKPNGMIFDSLSGEIQFLPYPKHVGDHRVRFVISNGRKSDTLGFLLKIIKGNTPPVISILGPEIILEK